ncbi:MAG: hypothetical protein KF851_18840 [Pirellulaceae bacterium]|nr:hypothetical protein [Pirellulaceae bacterium]
MISSFLMVLMSTPGVAGEKDAKNARHPVSIVEAEIYVQKHRVIMKLRCFADDLELLQGVSPMKGGLYDPQEIREATQEHARFLADRIDLLDDSGARLKEQIVEITPPEIPPEGMRQNDMMNSFCAFQFEYPLESPTEFLTINQKMLGEGYLFPTEFKLLLKQAGSDQPYLHMLKADIPETFRFDWENPALASSDSDEDWQAWFEKQREATLGITSYSSVYSFVYITNFEVRHEILIPLASLATMIDFERADENYLDVGEQDAAKRKIEKFFAYDNEVVVDGINVKPVFDRIDFYGLDLRDFAMRSERKKINMANGRIGVIMSYPIKTPPTSVEVKWEMFNDAIKIVDSAVFAYDDLEKTQFSMFSDENIYRWTSTERKELPMIANIAVERLPRKLPLVSIGLVGLGLIVGAVGWTQKRSALIASGLLLALVAYPTRHLMVWPQEVVSGESSQEIFKQLHQNIFRAFDYHNESDVYDALAKSVDGPLLRDLYLQINERLTLQDQGGAIAKIEQVDFLDGKKLEEIGSGDELGFEFRCRWNLVGTVEHWGHIHERTNQYDAKFKVQIRDQAWKITQMQGLDEQQIAAHTRLRQF